MDVQINPGQVTFNLSQPSATGFNASASVSVTLIGDHGEQIAGFGFNIATGPVNTAKEAELALCENMLAYGNAWVVAAQKLLDAAKGGA